MMASRLMRTGPVSNDTVTTPITTAWSAGATARIALRERRSASAPPHSNVSSPPIRPAAAMIPALSTDPVVKMARSGKAKLETLLPSSDTALPLHQNT